MAHPSSIIMNRPLPVKQGIIHSSTKMKPALLSFLHPKAKGRRIPTTTIK